MLRVLYGLSIRHSSSQEPLEQTWSKAYCSEVNSKLCPSPEQGKIIQ